MPSTKTEGERQLRAELKRLRARLAEAESTLKAIRSGEVDAIVVDGPQGSRIFTLKSPEEPYRILAEGMNEGVATLSDDGTILFCNRRMSEMIDLPGEQLLGSSFSSLLPKEKQPGFPEMLRQAAQNAVRSESELRRSDGTLLPVQLSLSSISLEECRGGICVVAADVSDQKRVQEEVRHLNAELEKQVSQRTAELQAANLELEAFNYAVAHDLRAPLRHIHGFSDILQQDAAATLSDESRHALDCIRRGTLRMEGLLESLLSLSRFGRQALHRQPVELKRLVEEVIRDLVPDIADRQIEWKVGDLPTWDCDATLMKIVFWNLLSNAIKFTRPRSLATIEVDQTERNGESVLFVRDNGAGFDVRYAGRLFGVFQRLHNEKDFEGTGVGLATVQRVLQKHGGRIWAEAQLDKGATFYFTCGGTEVNKKTQLLAQEVV